MITSLCRSRFSTSMVGLTLLLMCCRRVAEADHPEPQGPGVDHGRGRRRLRHLCRHRRRPGLCAGVVLWYDVLRRACDAMITASAAFMALALSSGCFASQCVAAACAAVSGQHATTFAAVLLAALPLPQAYALNRPSRSTVVLAREGSP